jgi:beta-glucosidase
MTAHPIVKQLIKEWNIDGIISTDAGGERYMVTFHKIYKSLAEAAAATVKTGTNQILDPYDKPLHEAIENKLITEAELDSALRGKFRTVIRLGLLDPPEMVLYTKIKDGEEPWNTEKHKAVARATSLESIVLLKNARNFLPLKKESIRSIAVIGPRANEVQYDYYSGPAPYLVTPLDGIKARLGSKVTVNYAADNTGDAAVKAAKASDVAVVVVGNHPWCGVDRDAPKTWEESNTVPCTLKSEGREGRDRYSLTLEAEELVKQVYAANPKTIVVIVTSFPYAIVWSEEHVPAILRATHSAQELGNSLAGVIFGDFNPSGKLTSTWVRSLDQLPPMLDYNIRNGRTYMYQKTKPLYPFGFGLSYTTFKYSNLRTSAPSLKAGAEVTVSVDVRNTGSREGAEVVQLYFSHQKSSVQRPIKELGGFARVSLKPGETKTVQIPLKAQQLAYWDEGKNGWVVEEEPVKIMAGASSADMRLEKTLPVVK